MPLSWALAVERVTRIDSHYQLGIRPIHAASDPWSLGPLTSQGRAPPVPVTDPSLPGLIAR